MALRIDLGLRTYDIEDADGNFVGAIRFNPADIGFVARWNSFQEYATRLADSPPRTPQAMAAADE